MTLVSYPGALFVPDQLYHFLIFLHSFTSHVYFLNIIIFSYYNKLKYVRLYIAFVVIHPLSLNFKFFISNNSIFTHNGLVPTQYLKHF